MSASTSVSLSSPPLTEAPPGAKPSRESAAPAVQPLAARQTTPSWVRLRSWSVKPSRTLSRRVSSQTWASVAAPDSIRAARAEGIVFIGKTCSRLLGGEPQSVIPDGLKGRSGTQI